MTDKQIIDGCEFQSDCIEYKDISYLKIMPICAIHELSIACHDKVNKCKYYKLYKQLKVKEQDCEKLKKTLRVIASRSCLNLYDCTGHCLPNCKWNAHALAQQTLKEITSEVEDDRQD